jgi:Fur family transcriptional regulator, iron response regulator
LIFINKRRRSAPFGRLVRQAKDSSDAMTIGLRYSNDFAPSGYVAHEDYGEISQKLRDSGLRPTKQRVLLLRILAKERGHATAKILHEATAKSGMPVSLATVYNTVHQLTKVGLLRSVTANASTVFFEIDKPQHFHFFVEAEKELVDIPADAMQLERLPPPPVGYSIRSVDILVRLRRK